MYTFNREEYEKRIQWYKEARFGMFIHWGLYAIPARGEWVRHFEEMPSDEYDKYMDEFTAKDCDIREWVHLAKEAGMKYVVFTAKHHDGFCLFDTKYTDFNSMNAPCHRDFVREFTDAVRAEGLKVGIYYSIIDWRHPDYPHYGDEIHPMRNNSSETNEKRDFDRYLDYMHSQVRELMTNYGKIDLLFFDYSYDGMRGEKWKATKLVTMVRDLQPGIIINNRLEAGGRGFGSLVTKNPLPYHGDYVTPEQIVPPQGIKDELGNPVLWESCITMNRHWGYFAGDRYFKTPAMLIHKLVECVSKGGNMILNIGPDAYGNIPQEEVAILKYIAGWMKKNEESIYGCGNAGIDKPDFGRVTRKGNYYYFHVFENAVGAIPIQGIDRNRIRRIRVLESGHEVHIVTHFNYSDYPDVVFADLGEDPVLPDPVDYVLKVEVSD